MSRIVVIDDEPVLRLTFRLILEQDGHEVWDAENGRDGVDLCRHEHPDLVITDMMMPGQEGSETMSILHEEFPNLPVIAMSGAGIVFAGNGPKNANGYRYVAKPVDGEYLLQLVHSLLSESLSHERGECPARGEESESER